LNKPFITASRCLPANRCVRKTHPFLFTSKTHLLRECAVNFGRGLAGVASLVCPIGSWKPLVPESSRIFATANTKTALGSQALSCSFFLFFSRSCRWLVVVLVVDLAQLYRRMRVGWRRRRMHHFWSRLPPCATQQTLSLWRLRTTVTSLWHSLPFSHFVLRAAACRSFLRGWHASRKRLLRRSPLLLLRMHGGG
jgi:hypothetical protein